MSADIAELFGPETAGETAAAIGAFDGVHRGHRLILSRARAYAEENGLESAAVLFDPLPSQYFGRLGMNERILLPEEQTAMIRDQGIQRVITLPFTAEIADMPAEEFLTMMQSRLHCRRLFMGDDFNIGRDRKGTAAFLAREGAAYGFSAEILPKEAFEGEAISSSRIRAALYAGELHEAAEMLGYPFFFSGKIIHGEARGRKLGFPTLNIPYPEEKVRVPNGVYAVYVTVDGKRYASVTNIGVRPTFDDEARGLTVESFLLNAEGNFYGKAIKLELVEKLRDEIRFDSADALKAQISRDIDRALAILHA